jgi:NAD(P)-dependent dehydrogenase (short-subunit alcohol dehydrogenase family)
MYTILRLLPEKRQYWGNIVGKLDGQTVIVTGASRGIGAEIAKALAAEGGKIVCVARTLHPGTHDMANYMKDQGREGEIGTPFPGSLEETVSQIKEAGGDATALAVDISTEAECERLVNEALDIYGPIDVLVNNAALAVFMPVQEMPLASWEQTFQIIVHSSFMLSKLVLPNMVSRKHGAIVNVSSSGAVGPGRAPYLAKPILAGTSGYGAAKAALERFTQGLAQEIADDGIAVTAVGPSLTVPTSGAVFHGGMRYVGDENGEQPEVMGQAVLLLATEPAKEVNGRVTYSQQILQEYGWITNGVGTGIDPTKPGSGFSMI